MPLFELGYRRYEGKRTSQGLRWWPITRMALTIAWRSKLMRRLIYFAYAPMLYFGPLFWVIGQATDPAKAQERTMMGEMAEEILGRTLFRQLREDPDSVRAAVWAIVFALFIVQFQIILAGIVAAIAGPPLIANDMRSRAFLIYFARPVSRWDYVIGKAVALASLLAMVTLGPSLALYALSIAFSPSLATVMHTLPVVLAVVLASLAVIVPATVVVLWLSSLTRQPRFAAVAWAVICGFGFLTHKILQNTPGLRDSAWTFLISLPGTVRAVQLSAFDVEGRLERVEGSRRVSDIVQFLSTSESTTIGLGFLVLLCVAGLLALRRRVGAPTRI